MIYQIISADTVRRLEDMVNTELRHGWRVTGGLAVCLLEASGMLQPPQHVYLQAMIREAAEPI